MQKKTFILPLLLFLFTQVSAQTIEQNDTIYNLDVDYGRPQKYEIAGITVSGAEHYEDFVLIGFSGLSIGDVIEIPGDQITAAVKRFWTQGLFSRVKIHVQKVTVSDRKVWLHIELQQRPRISEINFNGLKKSESDELQPKLGLTVGNQITPNISDRAKTVIERFMHEKGFLNADVAVYQKDDPQKPGYVIVDVEVNKKLKTRVKKIIVTGNDALTFNKINRVMKKTNDNNWRNIFRTKKFVQEEYEKDKVTLIEKYNEIGYRDAYIVTDSVVPYDDKSVSVHITVDEGEKYYFRNIKWIGNTIYPYEYLDDVLGIEKGDIYNHKLLMDRLEIDQDAVSKLYQDRGYLFSSIEPVEVMIDGDSIDIEMRIYEGKPATINKIGIYGNTRMYEHVIRRELYIRPGQLYSQSNIIRSVREMAQMKHFDEEKLGSPNAIDIQPNEAEGTVDVNFNLETKGSDQFEFSIGWGATGIVGSVGLKFSNFAIQNLFKPESYRIVPQGEGQTLTVNVRTNGRQYSSVSLSFLEPWLGGKRPNSLSTAIYFANQTGISKRYNDNYYNNYYNNPYSYGGYYGGNSYYNDYYLPEFDPETYMRTFGASIGYGKRLDWPDDYFTFYGEFSFQRYKLSDWFYGTYPMSDGVYNNLSFNLNISRNSIDNPIYTRRGSSFSLGLQITPPYSLFSKKDYSNPNLTDQEKYKYPEYHKWKFNAKTFTPLSNDDKLVLMGRVEFGYLGHYNKDLKSPFETFNVGGDGMTAWTSYGMEYISLRGYNANTVTPIENGLRRGYVYSKYTVELRYPVLLEGSTQIWLLGFAEAGNSFSDIRDYRPFDLKRSAGVGVRVFLPMFGLLGIDWAYGFDKVQTSQSVFERGGSRVHFVLGQDL
ncbi:MAG: BamA/TamA family outer membrane protein [Prevotellaceae bacterium]|jgi:outer membrane protein insertion porin family|nr:BamA/TamA family outer membrane protein [Prevotellaceae bacterium]